MAWQEICNIAQSAKGVSFSSEGMELQEFVCIANKYEVLHHNAMCLRLFDAYAIAHSVEICIALTFFSAMQPQLPKAAFM